jgi:hypothetical protein
MLLPRVTTRVRSHQVWPDAATLFSQRPSDDRGCRPPLCRPYYTDVPKKAGCSKRLRKKEKRQSVPPGNRKKKDTGEKGFFLNTSRKKKENQLLNAPPSWCELLMMASSPLY